MNIFRLFVKIRNHWWFVTMLMILGGLIGVIASVNKPSLYEATSIFSISIDYTQTGALTDIQEDQVMRNIGYVISSDKVMQSTHEKTIKGNCRVSRQELDDQSYLDRQDASWFLRIRNSDPGCAMEIVNSWAEITNEVLQEGLFHATLVDANNILLAELKKCMVGFNSSPQFNNLCGYDDYSEIQDQINIIGLIIRNERKLSEGLMPALSINLVRKAALPSEPVQNDLNLMVLSGMVVGLFISLLIITVHSEFPEK